ncbi:hypothetical protein IPZ58_33835 [Streptomyces roseoverticillatus]|uniref:hypothetical protein n=1 Tax=Streptomyces roseoverticillatus TaxID=66429 RepID=UPI001F267E15|nr:hypothetical protein [Streptomyces roseoverticillatus]MCF3106511.1 hypothetical protein [Streptomyces roseoverticillatus]
MKGTRRRGRRAALAGAVAVLAGLVAGCGGATAHDGARDAPRSPGRQVPYWLDDAAPPAVAQQLHVAVPAAATEVKAAHQKGFQDDGLLLAFVLPSGEVDGFVAQLAPERPLRTRQEPVAGAVKPMTPFAHLGLPEPESLPGVREGQVCAPCQGDLNFLHVAVTRAGEGTSRVYLRGAG